MTVNYNSGQPDKRPAKKSKPPNWVDIKARYLKGEKPKDIAPDFGLTAKQISEKANYEGWVQKKARISEKVEEKTENAILSLKDLAFKLAEANLRVHLAFVDKLAEADMMATIQNPYLFDGERVNSLFQTAMNNATKLTQGVLSGNDEHTQDVDMPEPDSVNAESAMAAIKKVTGE